MMGAHLQRVCVFHNPKSKSLHRRQLKNRSSNPSKGNERDRPLQPINKNASYTGSPGKINMELENTPLEKEKLLPNHHFQVSMLVFWGVIPKKVAF